MAKHFYKKFDDPSKRFECSSYHTILQFQIERLGFDSSNILIYNQEDTYYGSHRYPDYIEVYVDTDDETIITALTLVM